MLRGFFTRIVYATPPDARVTSITGTTVKEFRNVREPLGYPLSKIIQLRQE